MSRYTEICDGSGANDFEIKDISGYKKWKESLDKDTGCAFLLYERYSKDGGETTLRVYIGEPRMLNNKFNILELDTSLNHFSPEDDVLTFWSGLSLFTKEPIDLLQTDEEWPYLTKVFGCDQRGDEGMWRLWAHEGKVIIQQLGFKILKTETYKAKDLIDEDVLKALKNTKKEYCNKCNTELNLAKFDFKNRGYYMEVSTGTNYKMLCQKCYDELKKPYAEIKKLQDEIALKQKAITELRGVK